MSIAHASQNTRDLKTPVGCMLIEVMRMRIMNNEKKIQDAEKEAGGDEKLIFKFAWPYMAERA